MQEAENAVSCDIDWTWKWDGARRVRKVAETTKRGDEFPPFSTNVVLSHLILRRDHTCRKKGPTHATEQNTLLFAPSTQHIPLLTGHCRQAG